MNWTVIAIGIQPQEGETEEVARERGDLPSILATQRLEEVAEN